MGNNLLTCVKQPQDICRMTKNNLPVHLLLITNKAKK